MCDTKAIQASCNAQKHPMSNWQTQIDKLLADHEGVTRERYATGLASFRAGYAQSYNDEPDAALITDDEVCDYRVHLMASRVCNWCRDRLRPWTRATWAG
jgi:hypothetical protein